MKKVIPYLIACSALLMSNVASAESPHEFSANIAFSTDYMYRGFTQTSSGPAVSGGFDYAHASGFYAGTWASSVKFGGGDDDTTMEIDYYAGYGGELSSGIGYDFGVLYYHYPNTDADADGDYNFVEFYGSLAYTFSDVMFEPSIGASFAVSPDYYGETGDSMYNTLDLGLGLGYGIGLAFQYGNLAIDEAGDYGHWSVGLSKDWRIFTFDVSYYDSMDSSGDCPEQSCEAAVFTVSSSF